MYCGGVEVGTYNCQRYLGSAERGPLTVLFLLRGKKKDSERKKKKSTLEYTYGMEARSKQKDGTVTLAKRWKGKGALELLIYSTTFFLLLLSTSSTPERESTEICPSILYPVLYPLH